MNVCLNNTEHKFKGNENSPLGLGYSPKKIDKGSLMLGKDRNLWFVKETKNNKIWCKLDFDNLSKNCYVDVFFPQVELLETDKEEIGIEDKFGGNKPFFIEGEKWPLNNEGIPMTFICQFINPLNKSKKELIRIFLPLNDESLCDFECHITKINLNLKNLKNQIIIENKEVKTSYPTYLIKKWNKNKELKSFEFFCNKFNLDETSSLLDDYYYKSIYVPSTDNKVGGTPTFCQYYHNIESKKHLIQIAESEVIPYSFGDCGITHIFSDLEFYWDCY